MKYEVVLVKPDGTEEVIHRNLTEHQAIGLFEGIDNTYYREQNRPHQLLQLVRSGYERRRNR